MRINFNLVYYQVNFILSTLNFTSATVLGILKTLDQVNRNAKIKNLEKTRNTIIDQILFLKKTNRIAISRRSYKLVKTLITGPDHCLARCQNLHLWTKWPLSWLQQSVPCKQYDWYHIQTARSCTVNHHSESFCSSRQSTLS